MAVAGNHLATALQSGRHRQSRHPWANPGEKRHQQQKWVDVDQKEQSLFARNSIQPQESTIIKAVPGF